MKFYFFIKCFISISLLISISLQVQANTYETLTAKEKSAAHSIVMLNYNGAQGTGFFISPKEIVTNFHMIESFRTDELKDVKLLQKKDIGLIESPIKITKILALSATHDLAILETNKSTDNYLKIRTNPLNEKEKFFTLAYPNGQFSKISQIATSPWKISLDTVILPINKRNLGGVSGGPLLDIDNQVVGVNTAGVHNIFYAAQAEKLKQLKEGAIGFPCKGYNTRLCIQEAIKVTIQEVNKGNVNARYQLGQLYLHGRGVKQNHAKALSLIHRAAELGHSQAQHEVGDMYLEESGVQNTKKSLFWFRKSAKSGYILSQGMLGLLMLDSSGSQKKQAEGFLWMQKAAEQGLSWAQTKLAVMFYKGDGRGRVPKDLKKSFYWAQKAAETDSQAQAMLAVRYSKGDGGVPKDLKKAAYYRDQYGAEKDSLAQQRLALMFYTGDEGVPKDLKKAYDWIQKAVKQDSQALFQPLNITISKEYLKQKGCRELF